MIQTGEVTKILMTKNLSFLKKLILSKHSQNDRFYIQTVYNIYRLKGGKLTLKQILKSK